MELLLGCVLGGSAQPLVLQRNQCVQKQCLGELCCEWDVQGLSRPIPDGCGGWRPDTHWCFAVGFLKLCWWLSGEKFSLVHAALGTTAVVGQIGKAALLLQPAYKKYFFLHLLPPCFLKEAILLPYPIYLAWKPVIKGKVLTLPFFRGLWSCVGCTWTSARLLTRRRCKLSITLNFLGHAEGKDALLIKSVFIYFFFSCDNEEESYEGSKQLACRAGEGKGLK